MYTNGFLITSGMQVFNGKRYLGIENNPWPLDREILECFWMKQQLEDFDRQIEDLFCESAIALADLQLAREYTKICRVKCQNFDIKYIEVIRNEALAIRQSLKLKYGRMACFLGFDVGECAYDYYSSLLADIIARPHLLGVDLLHLLNKNGLFSSIYDANLYLERRNAAIANGADNLFERGQMDIIAIYSATDISTATQAGAIS